MWSKLNHRGGCSSAVLETTLTHVVTANIQNKTKNIEANSS